MTVLQVPQDIGEYCRKAALALEYSARFLTREIDLCRDPCDAADAEGFTVFVDSDKLARIRDNLRTAADALEWLAKHGDHGTPVEAVDPGGAE